MQIEINKKEFEKIGLRFRTISSRLLRTDSSSSLANLLRFLNFIEQTPLLKEFVDNNNVIKFDISKIVEEREMQNIYNIPVEPKEEISFTYQLLKYCSVTYDSLLGVCMMYSYGDTKYDSMVARFNKHATLPFVNHISTYWAERMIDMKEDGKIVITVNGGQVNMAQDNSTINSNQVNNIGQSKEEIIALISLFKESMEDILVDNEEKEETIEMIEAAYEETQKEIPKRSIIKAAISHINNIVSVSAITSTLIENGEKIVGFLKPFINLN